VGAFHGVPGEDEKLGREIDKGGGDEFWTRFRTELCNSVRSNGVCQGEKGEIEQKNVEGCRGPRRPADESKDKEPLGFGK